MRLPTCDQHSHIRFGCPDFLGNFFRGKQFLLLHLATFALVVDTTMYHYLTPSNHCQPPTFASVVQVYFVHRTPGKGLEQPLAGGRCSNNRIHAGLSSRIEKLEQPLAGGRCSNKWHRDTIFNNVEDAKLEQPLAVGRCSNTTASIAVPRSSAGVARRRLANSTLYGLWRSHRHAIATPSVAHDYITDDITE